MKMIFALALVTASPVMAQTVEPVAAVAVDLNAIPYSPSFDHSSLGERDSRYFQRWLDFVRYDSQDRAAVRRLTNRNQPYMIQYIGTVPETVGEAVRRGRLMIDGDPEVVARYRALPLPRDYHGMFRDGNNVRFETENLITNADIASLNSFRRVMSYPSSPSEHEIARLSGRELRAMTVGDAIEIGQRLSDELDARVAAMGPRHCDTTCYRLRRLDAAIGRLEREVSQAEAESTYPQ